MEEDIGMNQKNRMDEYGFVNFEEPTQISLFEGNKEDTNNIIDFPKKTSYGYKPNYKKGEEQTVYPIKTYEQLSNMLRWIKEHKDRKYVLGFILGVNLGLRANELLAIKKSDLFFSSGGVRYIDEVEDTSDAVKVYQSKTSKIRHVFLNRACVEAIHWYYGNVDITDKDSLNNTMNPNVFCSREGGVIKPDTFRKVLKEAATACGIKQNIGTHTLRKTWGWWQYTTNTGKQYGDVAQLQRLFGHESSMTTLKYLGIMEQEDKELYHNMVLSFKDILDEE